MSSSLKTDPVDLKAVTSGVGATTVSICIVNWNTRNLLQSCLNSVRETLGDVAYEILVCDNASSDGSVEMVEAEFPEVRLVRNAENVGFARANNQLIEMSCGEYILLLNSDAQLHDGTISGLVEFMSNRPRVAACSPMLLNEGGRVQLQCQTFPNVLDVLRVAVRQHFPPFGPYLVRRASESRQCPSESAPSEIVSAACMLIRKAALDEVGLLNDKLLFYGEEADFCFRLKSRGWQVWYVPDVSATHLIGVSARQNDTLDTSWHLLRGKLMFLNRTRGRASLIACTSMLMIVFSWSMIYSVPRSLIPWGESKGIGSLQIARQYFRRLVLVTQLLIQHLWYIKPSNNIPT